MNLNFYGDTQNLEAGIAFLSERLGYQCSETGIPVKIERAEGNITVSLSNGKGHIKYNEKIQFFRALGLFIEHLRESDTFFIEETSQFKTNGVMIDVSRNAVMTVDTIKYLLEKMALMGLNMLMLYTEDTYRIEDLPYFGYMRGRYTQEELSACDDFAGNFGIEMIPCIQTLGHLAAALKWDFAQDIRDTEDILLADCDKTYEFIEKMITSASKPFRSKRIHIGMDEAHNLGLGRYLDINGYSRRFDIMNKHLSKVKAIADRNGLSPMIWSDMYFRLGSKTGEYYDMDASFPPDVVKNIPSDTQLVYWDYYHNREDKYRAFLDKHKQLGCDIIFAGGIWTWNGLLINYSKTFTATNAGLSACKKEGIREVIATIWGDNGAETNVLSALLGFQLFAEHGYAPEPDIDKLKKRFKFCTGGDYDAFMDLGEMDCVPKDKLESNVPSNPAKSVLWQDVLMGLFDKQIEGMNLPEHYALYEAKLKNAAANATAELKNIFDMPSVLAHVLAKKCELGIKLKRAYDNKDLAVLNYLAGNELPELKQDIKLLRASHRTQWFKTYKPFGWEVIDLRYGGLTARIETAIYRLQQYLAGEISRIEELEEERLYFDDPDNHKSQQYGCFNQYHRIVSASPLL